MKKTITLKKEFMKTVDIDNDRYEVEITIARVGQKENVVITGDFNYIKSSSSWHIWDDECETALEIEGIDYSEIVEALEANNTSFQLGV